MMKQLEFEQFLPISIEEAWHFFSSPANLNLITPPELKFHILDQLPEEVYKGLIIRYRIQPMLSIPMKWVTEITAVEKNNFFIDEQIQGPYKVWHHEHHFKEVEGGVMMMDKLKYDIGWGFLGSMAGRLWVDKQVQNIFVFRQLKLKELFQ
jgi:ligand-binding SRPBCC domain-containing protein